MQTVLYLVRHGQTDRNSANLLQGRSNAPLNAAGQRQAQAAGRWLREQGIVFSRVYASPLNRAVQTARLMAPGLCPQTDERLTEMDYGPYEGTDLRRLPPELLEFFRDFQHNPAPAGMEALPQVVARLGSFLEELRREAPGGNVLIATHAIALKGALEYLTPEANGRYWDQYVGNCAVFCVRLEEGGFSLPVSLPVPASD